MAGSFESQNTGQSASTLLPHFFGDAGRELFGVYHAPLGVAARPGGVVLCYPGPQEYRLTHWAFRKLATLLARHGLHVLRFDYFGTGDSAGSAEEGSLAEWTADIASAVTQLADLSGVRRVSLVGMRLGAILAAAASARGLAVRDLVLWEPVLSGRTYLAQLEAVEKRIRMELHSPQDRQPSAGTVLGFPLPDSERGALASLDLAAADLGRPERLLVVSAEGHEEYDALRAHAGERGIAATVQILNDPVMWGGRDEPGDTLLAHSAPVAITAFLARRSP
jgi:pimeloyl-ACP methyl ester carboxylesterase